MSTGHHRALRLIVGDEEGTENAPVELHLYVDHRSGITERSIAHARALIDTLPVDCLLRVIDVCSAPPETLRGVVATPTMLRADAPDCGQVVGDLSNQRTVMLTLFPEFANP